MKVKDLINNTVDVRHNSRNTWKSFTLNSGDVLCRLYKYYGLEHIKYTGIYELSIIQTNCIVNTVISNKKFFENL